MKIIGIAANFYKPDEKKVKNLPSDLNIFTKVPSSISSGEIFRYPDFSKEVWHEMEVVLKICETCQNISTEEAKNVYDQIALGMDWTAKDVQNSYKEKGWPWALAKGFDQATFLSDFYPKDYFGNVRSLDLKFVVNGQIVEQGNCKQLKYNYEQIISFVSKFMTLQPGDLLMTGAPPSPGPIKRGDQCKGYINDKLLLDFKVI